jgi:uncharacterized protein (TIGR00369 family)
LEDSAESVPPGFEQLPLGLGFTDNLQPVYRRIEGDDARFGVVVTDRHCNSMGICHGGVLMTLADMAAATGVNLAHGVVSGSPTVHLDVDFIAPARLGEWIEAVAEKVSAKRRFGFCSGGIYNAKGIVSRFAGTIYVPDHDGLRMTGGPLDGVP